MLTKKCKVCEETKPITEFRNRDPRSTCRCYTCEKESAKNYPKKEYISKQDRPARLVRMAEYRHKARQEAIEHYGGKCACCGESHPEFLAIDHINGGGNKHHKEINGMAIGIWLRKHNYPAGFRVLCHNCNQSLGHFGYCPHQIQNSVIEF